VAPFIPELYPQVETGDLVENFDPDDDLGLSDSDFTEPVPYGFTWKFDFNAEDLDFSNGDPSVLKGQDTLNEWITHTINTEQFETPIFGADIGTTIFSLIGQHLDTYVMQLARDQILEAISVHDRIDSIDTIITFALSGNMYAHFSYTTDDEVSDQSLLQIG